MQYVRSFLAMLILFLYGHLNGQSTFNFTLELTPLEIPNLPGLHSYAYGQHEGKWLLVGGRLDGIHARQPFNSFPANSNNQELFVVDIDNLQFWSTSLNSLPVGIREQLQSTNMNYHQDGDVLYIIGGYAYSQSAGTHITFPNLTAIELPGLIDAIINGQSITPYFNQITDDAFAVTGGQLKKLGDTFYLVGGHRFDGRYNPMGNPTYSQTYTNAIRKFSIENSGGQLGFSNYSETVDAVHLRRRDYNLLSQIFPNGEKGFTISAGVFQQGVDLPFLYPVDITATGYNPVTEFNQYLSHYHSATVSLFDSSLNHMHMLFFGGMSQYYYQDGNLVQDNLVPFVKTISRVSRDASGMLSEYLMPVEMPDLQGSSAEFILHPSAPLFETEIVDLEAVSNEETLIGHILGGIYSPTANPFSSNQTSLTWADATIYEVRLVNETLGTTTPLDGTNPFDIQVNPNPFSEMVTVSFDVRAPSSVRYFISSTKGQLLIEKAFDERFNGNSKFDIRLDDLSPQPLILTVVFNDAHYVTKKLLKM